MHSLWQSVLWGVYARSDSCSALLYTFSSEVQHFLGTITLLCTLYRMVSHSWSSREVKAGGSGVAPRNPPFCFCQVSARTRELPGEPQGLANDGPE